jgi:ABC-type bacteriocin/lantibiotic exporter with double-glycine peptidase domain
MLFTNLHKFQTNVTWTTSDVNVSNNFIENISEENENAKQEIESEVCVSIKDATFAWPNSKIPVLAVNNLKIEEGIILFYSLHIHFNINIVYV